MEAPWSWDETLYGGSAAYYRSGRLPYPSAVADAFARELGLDGTQRLLDVGCGPGSLTLLLAPLVANAVGIDADGEMVAVAMAEAERSGVENVRWLHLRFLAQMVATIDAEIARLQQARERLGELI